MPAFYNNRDDQCTVYDTFSRLKKHRDLELELNPYGFDDWDFENYVYLTRQQIDSESDENNSTLLRLPSLNQYTYYNNNFLKSEPIYHLENGEEYHPYLELDSEESSSEFETTQSESGGSLRRGSPLLNFPPPPADYYFDELHEYYSECLECSLSNIRDPVEAAPHHFSFNSSISKKGLLQIDYSCNWYNLDKYLR